RNVPGVQTGALPISIVDRTSTIRVDTIAATAELMRNGQGFAPLRPPKKLTYYSSVSWAKKLGGFLGAAVPAGRRVSSTQGSGVRHTSPMTQANRPRRTLPVRPCPGRLGAFAFRRGGTADPGPSGSSRAGCAVVPGTRPRLVEMPGVLMSSPP